MTPRLIECGWCGAEMTPKDSGSSDYAVLSCKADGCGLSVIRVRQ